MALRSPNTSMHGSRTRAPRSNALHLSYPSFTGRNFRWSSHVLRKAQGLSRATTETQSADLVPSREALWMGAAVGMLLQLSVGQVEAFGPVSVKMKDITVEKVQCGAGISTVTGVTFSGQTGRPACLELSATVDNPSGKTLYNADVFGRVYDANGEAAIDDTENIRIAYIDEIQPGSSQVTFKLNVPDEQYQLGPLKLVGLKATGFPGRNLPGQGSGVIDQQQEDCDIIECEDESLIR